MKIINKEEAISKFNFEEVAKVFQLMGYTYSITREGMGKIPRILDIKDVVNELLASVEGGAYDVQCGRISVHVVWKNWLRTKCKIVIEFIPVYTTVWEL